MTDESLKDQFLGWQCRIRQIAVRKHDGRPQPGMRPRVSLADGRELSEGITLLLVHAEPEESCDLFRHIVKRTHDPRLRREAAIKLLSATHYQYPADFSDRMTALFSPESVLAATLLEARACRLDFAQFGRGYTLPCRVEALPRGAPAWEATFWHNHMFNPQLPRDVRILAFHPKWDRAAAA